jgi:hypothetical protein
MNDTLANLSCSAIPPEVESFDALKGISRYLSAVIDLGRQAFPSSALSVSLGQDAEDETHQYIALDVKVGSQSSEQLLTGQRIWSAGIRRVCPSQHAIYFVLGWQ